MSTTDDRRKTFSFTHHFLQHGEPNGVAPSDCGDYEAEVRQFSELATTQGVEAARRALETAPDLQPLLTLYNSYDPDAEGKEDGTGSSAPMWGYEKPPPMQWTIRSLIPKSFLTLLLADGGMGKSVLALYIALCVALGRSFFGLAVQRGAVLYVDYELDRDSQFRRFWKVAKGAGIDVHHERLENRLFYLRPEHPLGTEETHNLIMQEVEEHDISLIILDSLTIGLMGDATNQRDVVPALRRMREWPTTLAIDHVSHSTSQGNASEARAFGSVFKRNIARSALTLAQADGGGYVLQQEKANFGRKDEKVFYTIEWSKEAIRFERVSASDPVMDGAISDLSTHEVTLMAVKKIWRSNDGGPVYPEDVVRWREGHDCAGIADGTAKNHLRRLEREGDIHSKESGGYIPAVIQSLPAGGSGQPDEVPF